jgi:hypothetical protein
MIADAVFSSQRSSFGGYDLTPIAVVGIVDTFAATS